MKQARQQASNANEKINPIQHEARESLRLNKYISDSGYCSRRQADRFIAEGVVAIDGVTATVGQQVLPGQRVTVEGNHVTIDDEKVYIALNKPRGITCTTDGAIEGNISDFMNYPKMIFPIGRLDKDSSGLILLTNDGDIVNKILREEYGHDKEYIVSVNKMIDEDFITQMSKGVEIYNQQTHRMQVTNPSDVEQVAPKTFRIVLNQGLNRQIRRMTKALGFKVTTLNRVRIMNINLGDLKVGEWRYLSVNELEEMNRRIQSR
ncbi:pseudouridine synthase [Erysipelothrix rhusiopathiae]|uniref:pseudouridine synthase n=1 Tax=Erysipelothrix rhusiopathiae TaxID=1648 RepID=UPI002B24F07C|nr:pseudouridine synthase [Erysipelothrix rhusiopathiae]WRB92929.1 pseudouridine synthase [Erysipelothrix rhusiopathiae]